MQGVQTLILVAAIMGGLLITISALAYMYSMRGIKSKTVGDGQHGTARWATRGRSRMCTVTSTLRQRSGVIIPTAGRRSKAL